MQEAFFFEFLFEKLLLKVKPGANKQVLELQGEKPESKSSIPRSFLPVGVQLQDTRL